MQRPDFTVQQSLSFLRSHLNSRSVATCLPLCLIHCTMEYESPDWDPTPTEPIEVKDGIQDPTEAEPAEPPTSNEVKFEIMKKEEDSPPHSTMLCPPVRTVPDQTPTTSTPPPAKAPPVSHTSYRNLSTRTTSQATPKTTSTQHTAAAPHPTAPRPGHPPLNTTWVGPPHSHYPSHSAAPTHTYSTTGYHSTPSPQWPTSTL